MITAFGALGLVSGAGAVVAILVGLITIMERVRHFLARADKKLDQIHVLVNDRLTQALERIEQLEVALIQGNIAVPPSPEE